MHLASGKLSRWAEVCHKSLRQLRSTPRICWGNHALSAAPKGPSWARRSHPTQVGPSSCQLTRLDASGQGERSKRCDPTLHKKTLARRGGVGKRERARPMTPIMASVLERAPHPPRPLPSLISSHWDPLPPLRQAFLLLRTIFPRPETSNATSRQHQKHRQASSAARRNKTEKPGWNSSTCTATPAPSAAPPRTATPRPAGPAARYVLPLPVPLASHGVPLFHRTSPREMALLVIEHIPCVYCLMSPLSLPPCRVESEEADGLRLAPTRRADEETGRLIGVGALGEIALGCFSSEWLLVPGGFSRGYDGVIGCSISEWHSHIRHASAIRGSSSTSFNGIVASPARAVSPVSSSYWRPPNLETSGQPYN